MAKDDTDDLAKWFDNPPEIVAVNWLTDDELSRAICKAAIDKGIDPNKHGVIPAAEMLSPELLERREMTAKAITSLAKTFGISTDHAQSHMQALGLWAPDEPAQAALTAPEDAEDPQLSPWKPPAERQLQDQLEIVADAISAAKHYDKWLRPLGVMMLAFAGASALGAGVATGAAFFALGYGVFCDGFKSLNKGIAEFYSIDEPEKPKAISNINKGTK